MRQRVGIAHAAQRPRLLMIDEPTAGLDPERVRFRHLLTDLAGDRASCCRRPAPAENQPP